MWTQINKKIRVHYMNDGAGNWTIAIVARNQVNIKYLNQLL